MAQITVVGGTGYTGGHITQEAVRRGHKVISFSRNDPKDAVDGVTYYTGSVVDDPTDQRVVEGADVVIVAISPRGGSEGKVRQAVRQLAGHARQAGVRLGVVGGAGSLRVSEDGPLLIETDEFPDEGKPEATEMAEVLEELRGTDETLDWFYVSPAANYGSFNPGQATGTYRTGGDVLVTDDQGTSDISGADLALAVVDEIENPVHHRRRFTVAY